MSREQQLQRQPTLPQAGVPRRQSLLTEMYWDGVVDSAAEGNSGQAMAVSVLQLVLFLVEDCHRVRTVLLDLGLEQGQLGQDCW